MLHLARVRAGISACAMNSDDSRFISIWRSDGDRHGGAGSLALFAFLLIRISGCRCPRGGFWRIPPLPLVAKGARELYSSSGI